MIAAARSYASRRGRETLLSRLPRLFRTFEAATDAELSDRFLALRERRFDLAIAAAAVREAVRRVTGRTYYDVQLAGGLAIADGGIAEMATGEGKTLTAALPAALAAIRFGCVHVMTPNAYLAERDHGELADVFAALGLRSALLPEDDDGDAKDAAYACDVIYGTGYEFGFDFLKDEVAVRNHPAPLIGETIARRLAGRPIAELPTRRQPSQPAAIVDEADSVMLDEALTPLVLSGGGDVTDADRAVYEIARQIADGFVEGTDYRIAPDGSRVELADHHRRIRPPRTLPLRRPWSQSIQQSLHAKHLLSRGVDYVVRPVDGEDCVQIVDQQTGRVFEDRSWRAGLHQAVEVRESVPVTAERKTIARITRQRMLQQYEFLAGMTGTAMVSAGELLRVYGTPVVPIARRRPLSRIDQPARYFATTDHKLAVVADEAAAMQRLGRPVLIGCRTIAASQRVSDALSSANVDHVVLDGVQSADEATIVAEGGTRGRVTVATNMAGRGTDIKPDAAALAAGGLHVIATERHRSQRVDGQLIGRSARQGQPGSSGFFVSGEDELFENTRLPRRFVRCAGSQSPQLDRVVTARQAECEREDATARAGMLRRDAWIEEVLESCAG